MTLQRLERGASSFALTGSQVLSIRESLDSTDTVGYAMRDVVVEACADYNPDAFTATIGQNENLFHRSAALFNDQYASVVESFSIVVKWDCRYPHAIEEYKRQLNQLLSNAQYERVPRIGNELHAVYKRDSGRYAFRTMIIRGTANWQSDYRVMVGSDNIAVLDVTWERAWFWETYDEFPIRFYGKLTQSLTTPDFGIGEQVWIHNKGYVASDGNLLPHADFIPEEQTLLPEVPTPPNFRIGGLYVPPSLAYPAGYFLAASRQDYSSGLPDTDRFSWDAIVQNGAYSINSYAYKTDGAQAYKISVHVIPPGSPTSYTTLSEWSFGNLMPYLLRGRAIKLFVHLVDMTAVTTSGKTLLRFVVKDSGATVYETEWRKIPTDYGFSFDEFHLPPHLIDVSFAPNLRIIAQAYTTEPIGDGILFDMFRILPVDGGWLRIERAKNITTPSDQGVIVTEQTRRRLWLELPTGGIQIFGTLHGGGIHLWQLAERIHMMSRAQEMPPNVSGFHGFYNASISATWRPRFLTP